ncbi:CRISPR-associated protein Cas4 [Gallibacterium genomosp. 3]|nr:CRISPR-associated protein Cas4 [Gallibacterium genomosp. 3]
MRTISLSALQHYAFCPRQCALIHNEQVWAENYLTAQGAILHERVDSGVTETRKNIRYERSVHVSSEKLDLAGILDMLEHNLQTGTLKPIEYKRGKPKPTLIDEIQLCAQALCLEEMLNQKIDEGALWYQQTRHRIPILFTNQLRTKTLTIIEQVHRLLESGKTPLPTYSKQCKACSLFEFCQPQLFNNDKSISYVANLFTVQDNLEQLMDDA